jgi:hypothetical protein
MSETIRCYDTSDRTNTSTRVPSAAVAAGRSGGKREIIPVLLHYVKSENWTPLRFVGAIVQGNSAVEVLNLHTLKVSTILT